MKQLTQKQERGLITFIAVLFATITFTMSLYCLQLKTENIHLRDKLDQTNHQIYKHLFRDLDSLNYKQYETRSNCGN